MEIAPPRPHPLAILESHPGDDPTVMSIRAGDHRAQAAGEAAQLEVPGGIGDRGAEDGNRGGGAEPSLQLYLRVHQRRSTFRIDHRSDQLASPLQVEVDRLFLQRLGDRELDFPRGRVAIARGYCRIRAHGEAGDLVLTLRE